MFLDVGCHDLSICLQRRKTLGHVQERVVLGRTVIAGLGLRQRRQANMGQQGVNASLTEGVITRNGFLYQIGIDRLAAVLGNEPAQALGNLDAIMA